MFDKKWTWIDVSFGIFTTIVLFSMFIHWYSTDYSPLGWDTPKYIYRMLILKEQGLLRFLRVSQYEYFLYPLLGAGLSTIFHLSPCSIEIYFPIVLAIAFIGSWYFLSRKWFHDRAISSLTLLLTIFWYTTFNFPVFRHTNLLGFIFILVALAYLPDLYTETEIHPFRSIFLWSLFLLGGFTHPHTVAFLWVVCFIPALFCCSSTIRSKLGFKGFIDEAQVKQLLFKLLFLGTAVVFSFVVGFSVGEGTAMIFRRDLLKNPFAFYWGILDELYLDFGGFLAPFFILGGMSMWERLTQEEYQFRFKESILFSWTVIPLLFVLLSFISQFPEVYARRALLSMPFPLLGSIGMKKLFLDPNGKSPLNLAIDLSTIKTHVRLFTLLSLLIGFSLAGNEYLLYQDLDPARRYISGDTIQQLKWIGSFQKDQEKPIFVVFTSLGGTAGMISAWDDWIRCYVRDFYIYPGIIQRFLALQPPRNLVSASKHYFQEMKDAHQLNYTNLVHRKIYIVSEFYKYGTFNVNESSYLKNVHKGIYTIQLEIYLQNE